GGLLGRGGRLFRRDLATEPLAVSLAADAVGLRILDARGMALDADAEVDTQVERLFVGEPQFSGELVNPNLSCQVLLQSSLRSSDVSTSRPSILARLPAF